MDISAIEHTCALRPRLGLSVLRAVFALLARRRLAIGRLDLETMPDRVKRDLGFLDGREPRYEDERAR